MHPPVLQVFTGLALRVIARGAICADLLQEVPPRLMLTRLHRWWMFYREARSLGFTRLDAILSARARF